MKSRLLFVLLLLVTLLVISAQKNRAAHNMILNIINPIKQTYKSFAQELENRSKSYIFQKENIKTLIKENKVLKKYLLDQTHYLRQVNRLYKKIPSLEKLPYKSIIIVDTISYVKLNSFNEVLLTDPKRVSLKKDRVYGLIENNTVGGTAIMRDGNLYGYLNSNKRCKFSVFIGKNRTPGIIQGVDKDSMYIKYIPKWAKITAGDIVETSGLDGIFFSNIPVGKVESVKVENRYKTAYVKPFSDSLHPGFFFLITDPTPRLTSYYEQNSSFENSSYDNRIKRFTQQEKEMKSIPNTLQTKESEVDLGEFEIPKEDIKAEPININESKPETLKKETDEEKNTDENILTEEVDKPNKEIEPYTNSNDNKPAIEEPIKEEIQKEETKKSTAPLDFF